MIFLDEGLRVVDLSDHMQIMTINYANATSISQQEYDVEKLEEFVYEV